VEIPESHLGNYGTPPHGVPLETNGVVPSVTETLSKAGLVKAREEGLHGPDSKVELV
jgi:hypothetical protein